MIHETSKENERTKRSLIHGAQDNERNTHIRNGGINWGTIYKNPNWWVPTIDLNRNRTPKFIHTSGKRQLGIIWSNEGNNKATKLWRDWHGVLLGKRPYQASSFSDILETRKIQYRWIFNETPSRIASYSYVTNLHSPL